MPPPRPTASRGGGGGGGRAARRARASAKLRKLGIGKAALSASETALMTDKEARRVETKRKRGAVAGREKDVLAKLARFQSGLAAGASRDRERASSGDGEAGGREGAVGVSRYVSEGLYYAEEGEDAAPRYVDWPLHLFCRMEGCEYVYCGRLKMVDFEPNKRPMKFTMQLLDASLLRGSEHFLGLLEL